MPGDFSRDTFDSSRHFSGVLMQQGRVQLDADWNEQHRIVLHYLRTLAKDLMGPYAGPADEVERGFEILVKATTPEAHHDIEERIMDFLKWHKHRERKEPIPAALDIEHELSLFEPADKTRQDSLRQAIDSGKDVVIGTGRYYVNGILVENERAIKYSEQLGICSENQPELPDLTDCQDDLLFYLDVWERYITYVEDDRIREAALGGADTCVRSKVVWQVKLLRQRRDSLSCDSLKQIKLPSVGSGKIRARAGSGNVKPDNACVISPKSSYRGAENQLYRVEIHRGGKAGGDNGPTFKWSRENASVVFPIQKTSPDDNKVTLEHLGRDQHLSLQPGDWVELVDERVAMKAEAGPLAKVVDAPGDTIVTLSLPYGASPLPSYTDDEIRMLHPFLRRWDQQGSAEFGGGLEIKEQTDLNKGWLDLEDGIQIAFVHGEGEYRTGDYWLIPARVATGGVEWPDELENGKPKLVDGKNIAAALGPNGPRHYYAPLCLVKPGPDSHDCRTAIKRETVVPG